MVLDQGPGGQKVAQAGRHRRKGGSRRPHRSPAPASGKVFGSSPAPSRNASRRSVPAAGGRRGRRRRLRRPGQLERLELRRRSDRPRSVPVSRGGGAGAGRESGRGASSNRPPSGSSSAVSAAGAGAAWARSIDGQPPEQRVQRARAGTGRAGGWRRRRLEEGIELRHGPPLAFLDGEAQHVGAELELVAGGHRRGQVRRHDPAVQAGAVGAAEVDDRELAVAAFDHAVMARERRLGTGVRRAASHCRRPDRSAACRRHGVGALRSLRPR